MAIRVEKVSLTPELMVDSDVDWTLKALQSLGITSADKAQDKWRISIVTAGEWEQVERTSAIHLFPWDEEMEVNRSDEAWFNVGFDHDGERYVVCQRNIKGTSDYLNLISEKVAEGNYPRRWHSLNFCCGTMSGHLYFGTGNEAVLVSGNGNDGYFSLRLEKDGQEEIGRALKRIGVGLGINPQRMTQEITLNPGQIANSILDQTLTGGISQLLQKAVYNII